MSTICLPVGGRGHDVASTPTLLKRLPASLHRSKLLHPSLKMNAGKTSAELEERWNLCHHIKAFRTGCSTEPVGGPHVVEPSSPH